jgi:lysophospholipase
VVQGRSEFIEKYYEVITNLRQRGFAVLAFDWRGQGGSDRLLLNRRKGHVDGFSDYADDLDAIADGILVQQCPAPYFALAHSMGGTVLLHKLVVRPSLFSRVLITAPMLALAGLRRPRAARSLAVALDVAGFGGNFIPGGGETAVTTKPFAGNPVTSDPVRYARAAEQVAAAPHLGLGDPTIGWVHAAFRAMDPFRDPNYPLKIETPILMVAGTDDRITLTRAAEAVAARLKAGRIIVLASAKHEILMERDDIRNLFWAAFDAFIPGSELPEDAIGEDFVAA